MTQTKKATSEVKLAEAAHREATKALEAQAAVLAGHDQELAKAQSAVAVARKVWAASHAPEDWKVVEAAQVIVDQLLVDRAEGAHAAEIAKLAPLQALVEEHERAVESARQAHQRAVESARLQEILASLARTEQMIASNADNFLAVERQMAAAAAALQGDLAELGALRTEAAAVAARLGVEIKLPREMSRAHVLAIVSVAEDRSPVHEFVQLPRAPEQPHKRVPFLCGLLGESELNYEARSFPDVERIAALLDGTYRARAAALSAERKAELRRISADRGDRGQPVAEHAPVRTGPGWA